MTQKQTGYVKQAMALDSTAITPRFLNPVEITLHCGLVCLKKKKSEHIQVAMLQYISFKTNQQLTL